MSIWFFCGILTLAYGVVLVAHGHCVTWTVIRQRRCWHELHPTLWWGVLMTLFGGVLYGAVPAGKRKLSY